MFHVLAESGGLLDTAVEIGRKFGWKPAYFIAQVINFVLVLWVLKKFAFGPIQELLEKRQSRIADGEAKLVEIETKLAESEATTAALIATANDDAKRLITEATTSAANLGEQKAQEAVAEAKNIIAKAEKAAQAERATMAAELKQEFGRLVVATTSQVSGKVLTADDQARINQEALSSVQN
ncbi:F0F1 ATP synthase subunit B [Akkermansiaceae bacterium]|nr:F0F1 ATP synthase subunit B [Akkermansiaceae bacterium]MDB4266183.1 F0F1 ATP synthase subunit B [bacterium]MDA7876659.1 F0F1 ATP synthase subunit B [Akkermansiaceae bacterium]MDA8968509.1 F0F1 ATP synthase subunit B [Akkermansiaceae bacterium]MDB4271354.1 F0F1 ATP synthase subunit B [Akkermansiaceae bacterium]